MTEHGEGGTPPMQKPGGSNSGQGPLGSERAVFSQSWILEREDEFTDSWLKRRAEQLHKTPDHILTADRLRNIYFETQDKVVEEGASEKLKIEADSFLARLSGKIEQLDTLATTGVPTAGTSSPALEQAINRLVTAAERQTEAARAQTETAKGEYDLGIPRKEDCTVEEQRRLVRVILDKIESSNRDCLDFANSMSARGLETSYPKMHPEVAREVRARIVLHDSSELIRQAAGNISRDRTSPISNSALEAQRRNHDLDRTTVVLLLKEGLPGLQVAKAWDTLQAANYDYVDFVREVNSKRFPDDQFDTKGTEYVDDERSLGISPTNYFADSNGARKEAVRQLIIQKIGKGGEKSLQLAEKLAMATFENSVFNRQTQTGNDQLAEIIFLRKWRQGRMKAGRPSGPEVHFEAFDGFGTSWLRKISKRTSGNNTRFQAEQVSESDITERSWVFYCTVTLNRLQAMRELLMDGRPKPGDINVGFLQNAQTYFKEVDPPEEGDTTGPLKLKVWWLAGVLDISLADRDSGWTLDDYGRLFRAVLTPLSSEAGPFISSKQFDWIRRAIKLDQRKGSREAQNALRDFARGFLSGGSVSGGKKKR